MDAYRTEQQYRLKQQIPSYQAYWTYREGSSCVPQVVAMLEYANRMNVDEKIMNSPEIISLWRETVYTHWILNDIVSAKKEIAGGFIENLVVLAMGPETKAQQGMNHCVDLLKSAIAKFDAAAASLSSRYIDIIPNIDNPDGQAADLADDEGYKHQVKMAQDVALFIDNCRCMCVGNLHWR